MGPLEIKQVNQMVCLALREIEIKFAKPNGELGI